MHTLIKSCVITLDLSDHLGTYVQFSAEPNFVQGNEGRNSDPQNEITNFRKFNAVNMGQFEELVSDETWNPVFNTTSANEKYEKFVEMYNNHYDKAFDLKTSRRKNERKNPKPWILPWLEDACSRKNEAFHTKTVDPSPKNSAKYKKLKKFTDKHINLAKKKFYSNFYEKHQKDSMANDKLSV